MTLSCICCRNYFSIKFRPSDYQTIYLHDYCIKYSEGKQNQIRSDLKQIHIYKFRIYCTYDKHVYLNSSFIFEIHFCTPDKHLISKILVSDAGVLIKVKGPQKNQMLTVQ